MNQCLKKSNVICCVSPQLADAYKNKFNVQTIFLPPIPFIKEIPKKNKTHSNGKIAMIGSVWTQRRFNELLYFIFKQKIKVYWYGHGAKAPWISYQPDFWKKNGLVYEGWKSDFKFINELRKYSFLILPPGELNKNDESYGISKLSLPSRLFFVLIFIQKPIIVLGNKNTALAQFVKKFGIGFSISTESKNKLKNINNKITRQKYKNIENNFRRFNDLNCKINYKQIIKKFLEKDRNTQHRHPFEKIFGRYKTK